MIGSLQTGVSGLQQFQEDLQVIGNNIANVNTVGYKSATMDFEDQLSQSLANGSDSSMQIGEGVTTSAIDSNFTQGTINSDAATMHLAVSGAGFFLVKDTSSGLTYATRDGGFNLDANGYMINANGDRVQGLMGAATTTTDLQINNATAIAALNDTTPGADLGCLQHQNKHQRPDHRDLKRRHQRCHRPGRAAKFHEPTGTD